MTHPGRPASFPLGYSCGATRYVLVVLDVPDQPNDVLRGATPTDVALGTDIDQSLPVSDALDDALEKLIDEVQLEPTPDEAPQQ
jgi:hypothetical protein